MQLKNVLKDTKQQQIFVSAFMYGLQDTEREDGLADQLIMITDQDKLPKQDQYKFYQ